jgi:hypothetical protein
VYGSPNQSIIVGVTQYTHIVPKQTNSDNANNWQGLMYHFKISYDLVMREIWLEAWLTRYGLRVWMASSMIGKNDPPRYNVVIKILCLA